MNVFVFRPGGMQIGNVFTDWTALVDALATVQGRKIIEFDDSIASPCVIPPVPQGRTSWEMKDVSWAGFGPRPGIPRPKVDILEGAVFTGLRIIGGQTRRRCSTLPRTAPSFSCRTSCWAWRRRPFIRSSGTRPPTVHCSSICSG